MKVLSWNVNGLRAVYKKNFLDWLKNTKAEIVCLQETKIPPEQIPWDLANPFSYFSYFNSATKPGYAGVAIYTKKKPLRVETKIGLKRFDEEGRVLKFQFPEWTLINLYLPHGGRDKKNLSYKLEVYDYLLNYLHQIKNQKLILIGDLNVAHKEIDLARPRPNRNNIMFTPEERKQIDRLIELGFVDTFRKFHQEGGWYTWWAYLANARARNLGWRIDYAFASKSLTPKVRSSFVLPKISGSDHCPIGIEIQ